jgi:hypothetical protein
MRFQKSVHLIPRLDAEHHARLMLCDLAGSYALKGESLHGGATDPAGQLRELRSDFVGDVDLNLHAVTAIIAQASGKGRLDDPPPAWNDRVVRTLTSLDRTSLDRTSLDRTSLDNAGGNE